MNIISETRRAH